MMKDKKSILCDADDVIEDLTNAWVSAINRRHGTSVKASEITKWDASSFFPALTKAELIAPLREEETWNGLERIPGCFEVLKEINDRHILHIVTASHYDACEKKIEKILELYPFLEWDQFIIASHKQLVHGDYLIDDGVHNVIGGDYQGILFSRPHNMSFDAQAAGVIRASSWEEIRSILLD